MRVTRGDLPTGLFINGDSAFNLGPGMMVPTNKAETTDFDFEQSSNRMPIEYAPCICCFMIHLNRYFFLLFYYMSGVPLVSSFDAGVSCGVH